jgi:ferritin
MKKLISEASEAMLNQAIASELQASHMYANLSNQCQRLGYFGAATFFQSESDDERTHYKKIAGYLNDRGSVALSPDLDANDDTVQDLEDALTVAYDAEVALGEKYIKWFTALMASDPMTGQFLLQFLEIQRSSIGEYGDLLQRYSLVSDDSCGILMIDKELGSK